MSGKTLHFIEIQFDENIVKEKDNMLLGLKIPADSKPLHMEKAGGSHKDTGKYTEVFRIQFETKELVRGQYEGPGKQYYMVGFSGSSLTPPEGWEIEHTGICCADETAGAAGGPLGFLAGQYRPKIAFLYEAKHTKRIKPRFENKEAETAS